MSVAKGRTAAEAAVMLEDESRLEEDLEDELDIDDVPQHLRERRMAELQKEMDLLKGINHRLFRVCLRHLRPGAPSCVCSSLNERRANPLAVLDALLLWSVGNDTHVARDPSGLVSCCPLRWSSSSPPAPTPLSPHPPICESVPIATCACGLHAEQRQSLLYS